MFDRAGLGIHILGRWVMGWGTTLVLLATTVAQPPEGTRVTSPSSVEKEVAAFFASYGKTLQRGDAREVRALFVADGRFAWFTDGALRYRTRKDVVKALQGLAAAHTRLETTYSAVSIVPLKRDLATLSAAFRTRALVANGPGFRFSGVVTMLVERSPQGRWRVVRGHSSTPGGPPPKPPK